MAFYWIKELWRCGTSTCQDTSIGACFCFSLIYFWISRGIRYRQCGAQKNSEKRFLYLIITRAFYWIKELWRCGTSSCQDTSIGACFCFSLIYFWISRGIRYRQCGAQKNSEKRFLFLITRAFYWIKELWRCGTSTCQDTSIGACFCFSLIYFWISRGIRYRQCGAQKNSQKRFLYLITRAFYWIKELWKKSSGYFVSPQKKNNHQCSRRCRASARWAWTNSFTLLRSFLRRLTCPVKSTGST